MSDQQVIQFIQAEHKAGTSQSQIITKLIQRGVKIDQIRRLQKQYQSQIDQSGMTGKANAAMSETSARMRKNNGDQKDGKETQVTNARNRLYRQNRQQGQDMTQEGLSDADMMEEDKPQSPDALKVFGRDIFNNKLLSFEPNMNNGTCLEGRSQTCSDMFDIPFLSIPWHHRLDIL